MDINQVLINVGNIWDSKWKHMDIGKVLMTTKDIWDLGWKCMDIKKVFRGYLQSMGLKMEMYGHWKGVKDC
jgi:hypothetical protein